MLSTIADVSAALEQAPDAVQRARLEELASTLLLLRLLERQAARLAALRCRLRLDGAATGGEDDRRDGAAA